MHAKIENGAVVETTPNLRRKFPHTSFPRNLPDQHGGWQKVVDPGPSAPAGQRVASSTVDLVGGVPTVAYTYEAIPQAELDQKAMDDWKAQMAVTDTDMPRWIEDVMDVVIAKSGAQLGDFPAIVQTRYNDKKTARGNKPV